GDHLNHRPDQLSGGQQQRVGIARAFVAAPKIVFADEPTGNLDSKTTTEIMDLIVREIRKNHGTLVLVTHDRDLAKYADKIFHVLDGNILSVEENEHPQIVTQSAEVH
ncbi:MAG TPA: ATP-binding cassette domain-containing protein, partial [Clostridiales bacterium]|nr:ATP-binding cassette domain-containing protein [Clostridiales bacterium]